MASLQYRLKRDRFLLNFFLAVVTFVGYVILFAFFAFLVQVVTIIFEVIGMGVGSG